TCLTKASCTPKQLLDIIKTVLASGKARAITETTPTSNPASDTIPGAEAPSELAGETSWWAASAASAADPTLDRPAFNSVKPHTESRGLAPALSESQPARPTRDPGDGQSQGL